MLLFQQHLGCNSKALPGALFAAASGGAGVALHSALNARRLLVVVALPFFLFPLAPDVVLSAAADGYDGTSSIVHRVLTYEPFRLHTSTASDLTEDTTPITLLQGRGSGRGGLGRRLVQQAPPPRPPAAFYAQYPVDAPLVAISLNHLPTAGPRSRKYLMYWRAVNKSITTSAATFNLNSSQAQLITTIKDQFCHGPIVLVDGKIALIGGTYPSSALQGDGRKWITIYDDAKGKISTQTQMNFFRWYPTVCYTSDNKVLIVGGTSSSTSTSQIPVAELWNPSLPTAKPMNITMPPVFKKACGSNWYPFIALLPQGEILWWGDRGGSITDKNWTEIYTFPALPATFPYRTMYWFTSSIVLNAMQPVTGTGEYKNFSMTIFGGARNNANATTPASNVSARIDMYYCGARICDKGWVVESMAGQRRVIATAIVLPNGKVIIHGGAQAGHGGQHKNMTEAYKATLPAWQDLVYDPDAPVGNRYTLSGSIGIIRVYHTTSCLDLSGKVIATGCDSCGMTGWEAGNLPSSIVRSPDGDNEFRITLITPAEIAAPVVRPVITSAPRIIWRGSIFNVTFTGNITGATLVAPCATTHSISMSQKVIYLDVVSVANNIAVVRAPPLSQPAAANKGYYMLFLLGGTTPTGKTYSEGIWVFLNE